MIPCLKYVAGAKPGQKRPPPSNILGENAKQKRKTYEMKRPERKFKNEWLKGREWLKFTPEEGMTCTLCVEYLKTHSQNQMLTNLRGQNTFVKGCLNLKTSALIDHEVSKSHLKALEVININNNI